MRGTNQAAADLRIFTPEYEMPLAGHPTLGSAFIIKKLLNLNDEFILNTKAKPIKIFTQNDHVKLQLSGFVSQTSKASHEDLAKMVGLSATDIAKNAYWMNTGASQLLLQVLSKQALSSATIDKTLFQQICQTDGQPEMMGLWYLDQDKILMRFFFIQNNAVIQDSGTGSACANLASLFYQSR